MREDDAEAESLDVDNGPITAIIGHWTQSIHRSKNHFFHVCKGVVTLRQLQKVFPFRSMR
jgi:hypothetical protein